MQNRKCEVTWATSKKICSCAGATSNCSENLGDCSLGFAAPLCYSGDAKEEGL